MSIVATAAKPGADLVAMLAANAMRAPGATALVAGEAVYNWAGLEELSRRAAASLADLGVGRGDRVALWLPNTPAWPILYLACCRLGAIAVAVNTRYRAVELADIVGRAGCKVLACWPGFRKIDFLAVLAEVDPAALEHLSGVIVLGDERPTLPPALERLRIVSWRAVVDRAGREFSRAASDAPCNIFTTSGTTKAPKFVLHRQGAIAAHAHRVARTFKLREQNSPALALLPLGGVFGFNQFTACLAAGLPMVLAETFEPEEAARLVERWKPAWLMGSDDLWHRLLEAAPSGDRPFPSLAWGGTAAFNSALADLPARAEARGIRLCGLYGMSEVQAFYSRRSIEEPLASRERAGGDLTSPLAHVRIRNPETGELMPPGQPGELEAMGPSLMVGYYGDEAATQAAMTPDGYLRTGDFGVLDDADGHRFTFLNRMGDVLRLAGFLVNPQEIEARLQEHPTVDRAQVVAVSRPEGVRAAAFVIPRPGAAFDEATLIEHCRRGLANYKTPARVFAIDDFPVTPSPNGPKIQRARLRDLATARMA